MQLPDLLLALWRVARAIAENLRGAAQQLVLPGRDLVGVHVVLRGQLGQGLLALQGFKGNPRLERGGMVASGSSHRNCSFHYRNLQQSLHLSSCPKIPSQLSMSRCWWRSASAPMDTGRFWALRRARRKIWKAGAAFLRHLKDRGLKGVRLIVSDACRGLVEAAGEVFPKTEGQRCVVHFSRNVFSHVPNGKVAEVARMLKAIHAQEDRKAAAAKAREVVTRLRAMKLRSAAELVEQKVRETLTYYAYPSTHWRQLRTNNPLERIIREIRRRTRVVGASPDGHSALMLVAARLRHIASTRWGKRRDFVMETLLNPAKQEAA